jgi:hypothetical protein
MIRHTNTAEASSIQSDAAVASEMGVLVLRLKSGSDANDERYNDDARTTCAAN